MLERDFDIVIDKVGGLTHAEQRAEKCLGCRKNLAKECGQGQNRTANTRIFSPLMVPRLRVTIGHQVNEFKRLKPLRSHPIYRFEHIATNSSSKVVAKSVDSEGSQHSLFANSKASVVTGSTPV